MNKRFLILERQLRNSGIALIFTQTIVYLRRCLKKKILDREVQATDLKSDIDMTKRTRSWLILALSIVLILGLPSLLDRNRRFTSGTAMLRSSNRHDFDGKYMEELKSSQPEFLFIGNSLLDEWLDPAYLDKRLSPKHSYKIYVMGSGMAFWYVIIKHQVIPSGVHPETLFIFFKDQILTQPTLGLSERCLRWMSSDDPLFDKILSGTPITWKENILYYSGRAYPVEDRRGDADELLRSVSLGMFNATPEEKEFQAREVNALFDPSEMRPSANQGAFATQDAGANPYDFNYWLPRSFLPPIIDLARENAFPLCFVRIKTRPDPTTGKTTQSPELIEYINSLQDYLKRRECLFVDFTTDPEIDYSWYGVNDYIDREHRMPVTQKLIGALPEVLR